MNGGWYNPVGVDPRSSEHKIIRRIGINNVTHHF